MAKKSALASEIARRRKQLIWTQGELADAAGVGLTTVVQIEKNRKVRDNLKKLVEDTLAQEEKRRGIGPTLTTPPGTTDPSMKEVADVPASDDDPAIRALDRVERYLTPLLEDVRRTLAAHAAQKRDQSRKQG